MRASKGRVVHCQVEECDNQVPQKAYYQRYRICKHHSCLSSLAHGGKQQRWCQQCGRFHELSEFDGHKRTCRVKLGHHNQRRKAARLLNCSLSDEGGQLAAASSLYSEPSEASAQSPGACHAERAVPRGGQEQPGALRWAQPPCSPRRQPALPNRVEAPTLQLPSCNATRHQQQQEGEEWQSIYKHGPSTGQAPPPLLLQPPSMPLHVAGQRQSHQQAGQHNLKAPLHAPPQQRQQMSQQSMQSEGDSLPAQLAMWAKPSLGRQQHQQQRALPATAPAARQGVATSAAMLWEGWQRRLGAGSTLPAGVSDFDVSDGHLTARILQRPRGALPTAWSLPHLPVGHAELAAMLAAPKRICKDLRAGTAESKNPSLVLGPTRTHPRVPGRLASPAARPSLTAHCPSLATAATPLGAKAPCQQQLQLPQQPPPQQPPQQQLPAVDPASGKRASPGGDIDDILELLSWRSPKEDEPVSGSREGSWLSPPALPLSLPGSPPELAGAPTPFSSDPLLPS